MTKCSACNKALGTPFGSDEDENLLCKKCLKAYNKQHPHIHFGPTPHFDRNIHHFDRSAGGGEWINRPRRD